MDFFLYNMGLVHVGDVFSLSVVGNLRQMSDQKSILSSNLLSRPISRVPAPISNLW